MVERANVPNDLERLLVQLANEGDVEGLVALYEEDAVLIDGDDIKVTGADQLRTYFKKYVLNISGLTASEQRPALLGSNLAITSSLHRNGDISVEVARQQPDGHWLWVIDQFKADYLPAR